MIHNRVHHALHHAMTALQESHGVQAVAIPANLTAPYFQKYAHMLAERWGMKISTRALSGKQGTAMMFITERRRINTGAYPQA
jgi:hypothetical protein